MKLLKFILLLMLSGFYSNLALSQDELEGRLEKFKSRKIAFITEQLKLTPKEAEVFWPVYNEFDDKRQQINIERLKLAKHYNNLGSTISEKEASEMADKYVDLQKQDALLTEEYNKKFKAVLPATKVLKLYQAEVQFKRELLKSLRSNSGSIQKK